MLALNSLCHQLINAEDDFSDLLNYALQTNFTNDTLSLEILLLSQHKVNGFVELPWSKP